MKSKEEIEKIAIKCYTEKDNIVPNIVETESFIYGYQQCQEDMADEMVKLKNTVQLSVDLLCEADEEIALLKEQSLNKQD